MSQNWGPEKKSVSQIWGPEKKSEFKTGDRKNLLSKVGTGKELCISELGPELIFPVPYLEITIVFQITFSPSPYS